MPTRPTPLLLVLSAFSLLLQTSPIHAQQGATVAEQYLFQATNQHRAEHNLPPLTWDHTLAQAAHNHARVIAQNPGPALHQYPGEPDMKTRADQAGAHFSTISENVAGNATTAIEFDQAWMNSPVHRANILDPNLTAIGIAVVQNHGVLDAVEDFSRSVRVLGPSAVEQQAEQIIRDHGLAIATVPEAQQNARKICADPSSTAGSPLLIMQWDGADLTQLPATILKNMPAATQHTIAVGACPSTHPQPGFTTYHLAVLMF